MKTFPSSLTSLWKNTQILTLGNGLGALIESAPCYTCSSKVAMTSSIYSCCLQIYQLKVKIIQMLHKVCFRNNILLCINQLMTLKGNVIKINITSNLFVSEYISSWVLFSMKRHDMCRFTWLCCFFSWKL